MGLRRHFRDAAALLFAVIWCGSIQAGFFEGSISASIQNPVFNGSFGNNTSTAVYSISGSSIRWGSNAGSGPGMSIFHFFPNQSISAFSDDPISLGTVTFFNGTSELNSLIYGFDLVLDFIPAGGSPDVTTLVRRVGIGTTFNTGVTPSGDADYLSIEGLANSFWVWESIGATASLSGAIVGNPHFELHEVIPVAEFTVFTDPDPTRTDPYVYDPNDFTTIAGAHPFGFSAPAPAAVPEPASLTLVGLGAIGCFFGRAVRRRRQTTQAV